MEDQMTGDILPPIKLGGHDDGSMTRTLRSSQSIRKDAQINKKLEQITEQLKAVRLQRSTLKKHDDGRVYGPKTDYSTVPKKFFSHPRLDYVYGEIMHSPYLTNPKDRYPKAVYTMSETIKELKHKGINFNEIPESERPYDQAQMKRSFIKEVCNYNPKFNIPKAKKSNTGSVTDSFKRASTANSSILGRSTAGSSIASSATSMKDMRELREFSRTGPASGSDGGSRSGGGSGGAGGRVKSASSNGRSGVSRGGTSDSGGNRGKLNDVKPRKHASSTSMSLDASGFIPSTHTTSANINANDSTTTTNDNTSKLVKAMSQAAEFVTQQSLHTLPTESMKFVDEKEGEKVAFNDPDEYANDGFNEPDEEYNDDFIDPPEVVKPVVVGTVDSDVVDEEYEQDFETPVVSVPIVVAAVLHGTVPTTLTTSIVSHVSQQHSSPTLNTAAPDAYNEDFEPEVEKSESSETIPSEKVIYAATSASSKGGSGGSGGIVDAKCGSSVNGLGSVAVVEDVYQDDFAENDAVIPAIASDSGDVVDSIGIQGSVSGSKKLNNVNTAVTSDEAIVNSNSGSVEKVVEAVGVSAVHSGSIDVYNEDFEAPTVEVPVVPAPLSRVVSNVVSGSVGDSVYDSSSVVVDTDHTTNAHNATTTNDSTKDNIDPITDTNTAHSTTENTNNTTTYTTTNTTTNTTGTTSVSNKVNPESIKLRTDLIPGNSNNNSNNNSMKSVKHTTISTTDDTNADVVGATAATTSNTTTHKNNTTINNTTTNTTHIPLTHHDTTHSVLSDQSNQSIKTEEKYEENAFSPPIPSTVRSEISAHNMLSQSNSYNNSFNEVSSDMEVSYGNTEHNTPKSDHKSVFSSNNDSSGVKVGIAAANSGVFEVVEEVVEAVHDTHNTSGVVNTDNTHTTPMDVIVDTADAIDAAPTIHVDTTIDDVLEEISTIPDTTHTNTAHATNTDIPSSPTHEIDVIAYTEHVNTSVKENVTVSNNYLNSPTKGGLSNSNIDTTGTNGGDNVVVDSTVGNGSGGSGGSGDNVNNDTNNEQESEVVVEVEHVPDFEVSSPVPGDDADLYEIED